MKYEEALNLVKYGFKVYRPNWNNAYIYLFIYLQHIRCLVGYNPI